MVIRGEMKDVRQDALIEGIMETRFTFLNSVEMEIRWQAELAKLAKQEDIIAIKESALRIEERLRELEMSK
jgi:hypothetical protein